MFTQHGYLWWYMHKASILIFLSLLCFYRKKFWPCPPRGTWFPPVSSTWALFRPKIVGVWLKTSVIALSSSEVSTSFLLTRSLQCFSPVLPCDAGPPLQDIRCGISQRRKTPEQRMLCFSTLKLLQNNPALVNRLELPTLMRYWSFSTQRVTYMQERRAKKEHNFIYKS